MNGICDLVEHSNINAYYKESLEKLIFEKAKELRTKISYYISHLLAFEAENLSKDVIESFSFFLFLFFSLFSLSFFLFLIFILKKIFYFTLIFNFFFSLF